jgi:nucleolar protein 56|tara:strand:+ start:184 stop:909 length:726 start_codon:yes stop_codon:yes gene_type:complete
MGKKLFILFESASGYALLNVVEVEQIGGMTGEAQESLLDLERFSRMVKLHAFQPFATAADALRNINNISEGLCDDDLKTFLELQLPAVKPGKKAKFELGVQMPTLGQAIQSAVTFPCRSDDTVRELLRGVRMHLPHFVTPLKGGMMERAQLGLGHSYSRAKVKFNVNRADNMIIQAICLLDQLDKDLNTFAMRLREWYGWHFPELVKIVNDNHVYAECVLYIGKRDSLEDEVRSFLWYNCA